MLQMRWRVCVGVGRLGCRRGTSGVPGRCSIGPDGDDTYVARSCWRSWLARTHRTALLTWGGYLVVVITVHTVQYSNYLYVWTDSSLSMLTIFSCFAHSQESVITKVNFSPFVYNDILCMMTGWHNAHIFPRQHSALIQLMVHFAEGHHVPVYPWNVWVLASPAPTITPTITLTTQSQTSTLSGKH